MTEGDRHLDFRDNNFDLVRLFAAFQVALNHSIKHLKVGDGVFVAVNDLLKLFPGVPIFFFVSGFLISRSFERNSAVSYFVHNRI